MASAAAQMDLVVHDARLEHEPLLPPVGDGKLDLAIQPPRTQQRRIERVCPVSGHDHLQAQGRESKLQNTGHHWRWTSLPVLETGVWLPRPQQRRVQGLAFRVFARSPAGEQSNAWASDSKAVSKMPCARIGAESKVFACSDRPQQSFGLQRPPIAADKVDMVLAIAPTRDQCQCPGDGIPFGTSRLASSSGAVHLGARHAAVLRQHDGPTVRRTWST